MALHALRRHPDEFAENYAKALAFLESRKVSDGLFEKEFTGTGFPLHFYLRYDGYRNYFPMIALGRWTQPTENR
jgi:squalene-hopene/tetraprenyl-beta-curcumene cyclase